MVLDIDFWSVVHSENFSLDKHLENKMPVRLSDLDAEVKEIIERFYQALLRANDRLVDVVDNDDNYTL